MSVQFQPPDLLAALESPKKTIRVLHVVESLDSLAVETWLLRMLRAASKDYPHVHWAFFCVLGHIGRQDSTARELGAEVIHSCYQVGDKVRFVSGLREVMKRGAYDILHCHHDLMSAAYLAASFGLPFKKRIVHLHNTAMSLPTSSRFKSELAREPMRQICLRMADQIVGISKEALESLIGRGATESSRYRVVHNAVDTSRFSQAVDRTEFRRRLSISSTARVLLFVGRMVDYKNPLFVLEILKHLQESDSEVVAVFAGAGVLEGVVRETAKQKDLEERVRLLGFREDVPELMLTSDLLIWPSLEEPKEGLGLGIIEAQAAGLPILMSLSVPKEAIVVPELVDVLPLSAGPNLWARTARNILERQPPPRRESLAQIESSSFSMNAGVSNLMKLYELGNQHFTSRMKQ